MSYRHALNPSTGKKFAPKLNQKKGKTHVLNGQVLPIFDAAKIKANPLEKTIEEKVRKYAVDRGCLCYKFTSPSNRSVPDRVVIAPVGGSVGWLELKRKNKKPTEQQYLEMEKIKSRGCKVTWTDNLEAAKRFVDEVIEIGEQKSCLGDLF